jgi:hypothetical protein
MAALSAGCGSGGPICDGQALTRALAGASSGQTVTLGACAVTASVVVPAGVVLEGQGEASVIEAPPGEPALALSPGAEPTTVRGLRVRGHGNIAVLAEGAGRVTLEDVTVEVSLGAAVALDGLDEVRLTRVALVGPVVAGAPGLRTDLEADETATHGLTLRQVDDATLDQVTVTGFARFGALLIDSQTSWVGGGAEANLVAGLMVWGGTAELEQLALTGTMEGTGLLAAFAAIFTEGAVVTSRELQVEGNDRYGLVHLGATATHVDARVQDNGDVGVWIEASDAVQIRGAASRIVGNGYSGVVVQDSSDVLIQDVHVEGTVLGPRPFDWGFSELGDGLHFVGRNPRLIVEDVTLAANERVGVAVELTAGEPGPTFSGVSITGAAGALGAIAGERVEMGGRPQLVRTTREAWDDGIERDSATGASDAAFGDALDLAGIVTPTSVPQPGNVPDSGIAGIVTPTS